MCFLVFMLDEPLGRADEYNFEIQSKMKDNEEVRSILTSKDEGMTNKKRRFIVDFDNDMVIPIKKAIEVA